jgi:hypothetical protein
MTRHDPAYKDDGVQDEDWSLREFENRITTLASIAEVLGISVRCLRALSRREFDPFPVMLLGKVHYTTWRALENWASRQMLEERKGFLRSIKDSKNHQFWKKR